MLAASCPKCAKQVTVPTGARPESRVRCPLCAEEYSLERIFADLPPLLVLLDAPAPNGASGIHSDEPIMAAAASGIGEGGSSSIFDFDAREKADAAAEADTGVALAEAEQSGPSASAFKFGGAAPAAESFSPSPSTTTARPKAKKKGSPIKSLIGVVIGGLVALPMAQLILWYLPGGWGVDQRDPMNIGRDYPSSLGILAPSWVKDAAVAEEISDAGDPASDPSDSPPIHNSNPLPDDGEDDFPTPGGNETPTGEVTGPDDNGGEKIPPVDENIPLIDEPDIADPVDEPAPPKSPVKDAPSFTTAELGNELKTTKEAKGLIEIAVQPEGDGGEKRAAAETFVQSMSQLAHVVTFAETRPAGHLEHVNEMVTAASDSAQKRKIVSTLALLELGKPQRQTGGTIFMGVVREMQQRGELFETVIETATNAKKPVSVYTSDDPQATLSVGDTAAVLGVIVDEPNKNLSGYKGEPDPVVWGGYWHVVPVEE